MPPPPPPFVPQAASDNGQLAEAWKRIVARLIDTVIMLLVAGSIFASLVLADGESLSRFGTGDAGAGKAFTISLLSLVFGFLYEAVTTKMFGGTPGKLMLGMKVVRAADAAPVGWNESLLRWGIPALISLVPVLGGLAGLIIFIINLVFLFTDKLRQTIWDKVAKTMVINKR